MAHLAFDTWRPGVWEVSQPFDASPAQIAALTAQGTTVEEWTRTGDNAKVYRLQGANGGGALVRLGEFFIRKRKLNGTYDPWEPSGVVQGEPFPDKQFTTVTPS